MANQPNITRRVLVKAFPFFGAAAAVAVGTLAEVLPAVAAELTASERFQHGLDEMAKAMADMTPGADGWQLCAGADDTGKVWTRRVRVDVVDRQLQPGSQQAMKIERHTNLDEVA